MGSVFDELAARMDYHALFSEYIRLKKKGNRYFAPCPFHQEKDPSLSVDVQTGLWHCFGCKAGGNIFQFIAKVEHLEMSEVVEMLARRYNVDLSQYRSKDQQAKLTRREVLRRIVQAVANYYRKQLLNTSHGQRALEYLHGRGLTDSTIRKFGLGMTPGAADGLTQALLERNVRRQDLLDLNLSIEGRRGELVDMMRGRIIFPLYDHSGNVVSFAGRALGDEEPKYLNTRNTPLYNKSRLLYGLNFARKAITAEDCVFVVEGYMDVISLHQAGVVNAVATCGTALTREHIATLGRFTERFYLAFDGDAAGIGAALRSCEEFMAIGHYPSVLLFPKDKDPDDVAREGGKEAFDRLKAKAVPYPRLLTAVRIRSKTPDPAQLKQLFKEAAPVFRRIRDSITQDAFVQDLAAALKLDESRVRGVLRQASRPPRRGHAQGEEVTDALLATPLESLLNRMFARLLREEQAREEAQALGLTAEELPEGKYRELYRRVVEGGEDSGSPEFPAELSELCARLMQDEAQAQDSYTTAEYAAKVRELRALELDRMMKDASRLLAAARAAEDGKEEARLTEELKRLKAERSLLATPAPKRKAEPEGRGGADFVKGR